MFLIFFWFDFLGFGVWVFSVWLFVSFGCGGFSFAFLVSVHEVLFYVSRFVFFFVSFFKIKGTGNLSYELKYGEWVIVCDAQLNKYLKMCLLSDADNTPFTTLMGKEIIISGRH